MKRTSNVGPARQPVLVQPPGQRVQKLSGKPFKSGVKVNTVKEIVPHPVLPDTPSYSFVEDDSIVRASYCCLAPTNSLQPTRSNQRGSFNE